MATLVQAVRMALHYGEENLGVTDIFGEDVGPPLGGVFTATQGLRTAWNSPLDERGNQLIPGEPEDENTLKEMIDAPVGDRAHWQPRWPSLKEYFVPIGIASLVREGHNATIVSYGRTLPLCVHAADQLEQEYGLSF